MLSLQQVCARNRCGQVPLNRITPLAWLPRGIQGALGETSPEAQTHRAHQITTCTRLHSDMTAETMCFGGKEGD